MILTLSKAIHLAELGVPRFARAASVLDGCRIGRNPETDAAWQEITTLLPKRGRGRPGSTGRAFTIREWVDAVYLKNLETGRYARQEHTMPHGTHVHEQGEVGDRVPACPRCGDLAHQEHKQTTELGGVTYEVWHCANPARSTSATTGVEGCGSHTIEV